MLMHFHCWQKGSKIKEPSTTKSFGSTLKMFGFVRGSVHWVCMSWGRCNLCVHHPRLQYPPARAALQKYSWPFVDVLWTSNDGSMGSFFASQSTVVDTLTPFPDGKGAYLYPNNWHHVQKLCIGEQPLRIHLCLWKMNTIWRNVSDNHSSGFAV